MRRAWGFLAAASAAVAVLVAAGGSTEAQTAPTVTVEPTADLVDGSAVTVTVSGLAANTRVEIAQCVADATSIYRGCTDRGFYFMNTGTVTHVTKVDAVITVADEESEASETVDCREAGACAIGVAIGSSTITELVPLTFDPAAELAPPPTVTVEPSENLEDLQTVTVRGAGFVWSAAAYLMQCPTGYASADECDSVSTRSVPVDGATNTFEATLPAFAVLDGYGEDGPVLTDCREPDACVLVALSGNPWSGPGSGVDPAKLAVAPLHFDPDTVITPQAFTVEPSRDLVDGQQVTVSVEELLSGFAQVYICGPNIAYGDCLNRGWIEGEGEAGSGGEATVMVSAVIATESAGEVDCRTSAEPCKLVVSPGSLTSSRAGVADLHFDPGAPTLPPPVITVSPSTDLADEAPVTVSGSAFTPDTFVQLSVCEVGDAQRCDMGVGSEFNAGADGTFSEQITVASEFLTYEGETVDCRADPGCEVVAQDYERGRSARASLSFAAAPAPGTERYVDPVFEDVEVTEDVVYRETTDHLGRPVQLTMDIYEPAGDDVAKRPAIMWLHGDWFGSGDKADIASYAEAYAQRGWVAVTLNYRLRPDFDCCPTQDVATLTDALADTYEDARAGVDWLRANSSSYGIDPDTIVAGGSEAGAAAAWHLAEQPAEVGASGPSPVAGAVPIAGVNLGRLETGDPPVVAFHVKDNNTAPAHLSEFTCSRATPLGTACQVVVYDNSGWQSLANVKRRDIIRRSTDFLANNVLAAKGYVDRPVPPSPTPPSTTPTTTVSAGGPGSSGSNPHGGSLPRTGTDTTLLLVRIGLILLAAGVVIVTLARQKGKKAEIAIFAVMALTVAAVGGAFVLSTDDDDTDLATPVADEDEEEDHSEHRSRDHDDDDDDSDQDDDHDDDDESAHDDDEHDDGAGHGDGTGDSHDDDHDDGHGTGSGSGSGSGHGSGEGHDNNDGHHDPGAPQDPGHHDPQDPGHPPGDPGHPPGDPGHPPGDPGHPPGDPGHPEPPIDEPGFPDWWGPEEAAKGWTLINDTTAAVEPLKNRGLLPLLGYQWIFDGTQPGNYQHWISTSRIVDGRPPLTPAAPESLVFRYDAEDGPVLEAAMYMLGLDAWNPSDPLANVPEDLLYLPGWHIHDNLCFADGLRLVGIAPCPPGSSIIPTPPMLHVWIVPTACGRFAGVDENGLQCHGHEHP